MERQRGAILSMIKTKLTDDLTTIWNVYHRIDELCCDWYMMMQREHDQAREDFIQAYNKTKGLIP
jgi:hypothetical protein